MTTNASQSLTAARSRLNGLQLGTRLAAGIVGAAMLLSFVGGGTARAATVQTGTAEQVQAAASCGGQWTGFWTWNQQQQKWIWTWVWKSNCGSGYTVR